MQNGWTHTKKNKWTDNMISTLNPRTKNEQQQNVKRKACAQYDRAHDQFKLTPTDFDGTLYSSFLRSFRHDCGVPFGTQLDPLPSIRLPKNCISFTWIAKASQCCASSCAFLPIISRVNVKRAYAIESRTVCVCCAAVYTNTSHEQYVYCIRITSKHGNQCILTQTIIRVHHYLACTWLGRSEIPARTAREI